MVVSVLLLCVLLIEVGRQPTPLHSQSCSAKKILFVGSSALLAARDEPLRRYLFALGHTVTVRMATFVQATDAKDQDLVIISESAESVDVNTKLRNIAVPIITWEGWLQDDLGMTGTAANADYGENLKQKTIRIVDAAHPLAAGLTDVVATVINNSNKFHWGKPNGNATVVAVDVADAQHAMIYAYEQGAPMVGMNAPARRIFIHNATGPSLTTEGWRLFEAAVNWAVGCSNPPLPPTPTLPATAVATTIATSTPTSTATATATPTATASPAATPVTPVPPAPTPKLALQKQDILFVDSDEDGFASPGDMLLYIVNLHNDSDSLVTGVALEDIPDPNTTLQATTVRTDHGAVLIGNQPQDRYVVVNVGDLTAKGSVRIVFQVQIQAGTTVSRLRNQAQVRYNNEGATGQAQQLSDDPDTLAENDETITPLGDPATGASQRMFLPLIAE